MLKLRQLGQPPQVPGNCLCLGGIRRAISEDAKRPGCVLCTWWRGHLQKPRSSVTIHCPGVWMTQESCGQLPTVSSTTPCLLKLRAKKEREAPTAGEVYPHWKPHLVLIGSWQSLDTGGAWRGSRSSRSSPRLTHPLMPQLQHMPAQRLKKQLCVSLPEGFLGPLERCPRPPHLGSQAASLNIARK